MHVLCTLSLRGACTINSLRKYPVIYPRGSWPSCMPPTFRGDKAAIAEEGTVLLKPKLVLTRIRLASNSRMRGIGPSSSVLRNLQRSILHLHESLQLSS